jgi:Phospholipase_D-nuclease N-terminal
VDAIRPYIPYLIPFVLLQLLLIVIALLDLVRREKTRGPKWLWVLVILFINFIGPIIYLLFGREET